VLIVPVLDTFHHLGPNLTAAIELEVRLSIAAIEACHKAGIPHIVYAALDNLPEEVRVPTYVSKAKGKSLLNFSVLCPLHPPPFFSLI
jgi:hypothetical protein